MRDYQLKLEARWKAGAKEPYKLTANTILEAMRIRSLHERSEFTLKRARDVMNAMKKNTKNVGVVTDMQDLNVKIEMEHVETKQLKKDVEI